MRLLRYEHHNPPMREVTGLSASEFSPAEATSIPFRDPDTCAAVGLRRRLWLRTNKTRFNVKEEHRRIILCLHRTRQGFVEERTALYNNRLRGLICEFGIVLPRKIACLRREIGARLADLPGYANQKTAGVPYLPPRG
jgi:hypothetical protein